MYMVPAKLLLFVSVAGFAYLYVLPRRAAFVSSLLNLHTATRQDSLRTLAEAKIRTEICPASDMCEYKPIGWEAYADEDAFGASIIHEFFTDGNKRKFLFRERYGTISEIIDLR